MPELTRLKELSADAPIGVWPYSHRQENIGAKMTVLDYPGFRIRKRITASPDITIDSLAKRLEMTKESLLELLYGRNTITDRLAMKLSEVFPDTNPNDWLR